MTLFFFLLLRPPPISTLFPYTTLFRSHLGEDFFKTFGAPGGGSMSSPERAWITGETTGLRGPRRSCPRTPRSEEHTSELQSHSDLVCRLLLEKKKTKSR